MHEFVLRIYLMNFKTFLTEFTTRFYTKKLINGHMQKFFDRGDKVKVTIRFRGREMAHMDRGMTLLAQVKEDFEEIAKVEFEPKTEGRMMTMVLAPR